MVLKIKFRALLTMCSEPIENGLLIIENGNILEISSEALNPNANNVLDLSDHLLMPGFVNAHCHLGLTALADKLSSENNFSLLDGMTGQVWSLELLNGELFCGHYNGTFIILSLIHI